MKEIISKVNEKTLDHDTKAYWVIFYIYIDQRVLLLTALDILIDLVARNRTKLQCWELSAWHIT